MLLNSLDVPIDHKEDQLGICIQLDNFKYLIAANEEEHQYHLYTITWVKITTNINS